MILLRVEGFAQGDAALLAALHEVVARPQGDRRQARLRQRKVIGPEEAARFGLRIRGEGASLFRAGRGKLIDQRVLARRGEVARGPVQTEVVHVQSRDRGLQRIQRVGGVVLGAEQPLLLGGECEE